jgi:hypothetical protein
VVSLPHAARNADGGTGGVADHTGAIEVEAKEALTDAEPVCGDTGHEDLRLHPGDPAADVGEHIRARVRGRVNRDRHVVEGQAARAADRRAARLCDYASRVHRKVEEALPDEHAVRARSQVDGLWPPQGAGHTADDIPARESAWIDVDRNCVDGLDAGQDQDGSTAEASSDGSHGRLSTDGRRLAE